uniref:HOOK N-terminal domain-containing protein n=1 Tax=Romanomermis culicivorax TaxID=13658 RepID=A0A915IYU5_ROMCU
MIDIDTSFDNLIVWMSSLTLSEKLSSIEDISTGIPIASALSILDKEYFNEQWSSKIFDEPINVDSNWRLKVLALKKLLKSMIDYYEQLTRKSIADFLIVDVQAAAKDLNKQELFKILQLVVAVAINCPIRTTIIANISSFNEDVQRSIMMAIQGIEGEKNKENSEWTLPQDQHDLIFEQEIQRLRDKIDELSQENENTASKNAALENQVSQLKDEISSLLGEKSQLENKCAKLIAAQGAGSEVPSKKINQLTKRLEETEEEIFRLEHARDELRAKTETLTLENRELQSKLGNSSLKDDECQKMKDELEELRLKNVEFKKLEALLETYKRKLDETNQMKNEMKILQDKNSVFMNCAIDLEEEKRRNASFKTQLEAYKRQLDELNENSQSE